MSGGVSEKKNEGGDVRRPEIIFCFRNKNKIKPKSTNNVDAAYATHFWDHCKIKSNNRINLIDEVEQNNKQQQF